MNIVIVEDNAAAAAQLKEMTERTLSENGLTAEIARYENGVMFLHEYDSRSDIVFLDCDMPMMDGISVAERLREKDKNVIIIFVTNLMQYAVDGYEVDALDYILKPLTYEVFVRKFARALRKVGNRRERFLSVKSGRSVVKVGVEDVCYIEIRGHNATYHTVGGEIESRGTLTQLEDKLSEFDIVRCASCYMVNLMYVKKVESDAVILTDGVSLALTRTKKKDFMNKLAAYLNR